MTQASQTMLLDEREAARRLGLSVRTLQAWRRRGVGVPWVKLGRSVRYRVRDLERFVAKSVVEPSGSAAA